MADGFSGGRADPAFEAHIAPFSQWTLEVWENWLPLVALQKLLAMSSVC